MGVHHTKGSRKLCPERVSADSVLGNNLLCRGPKHGAFDKPCLCPLPNREGLDENGENDGICVLTSKTMALLLRPHENDKIDGRHAASHGLPKALLLFPGLRDLARKENLVWEVPLRGSRSSSSD